MFENLKGKKLLVIGADTNDREIVRTAQALGISTIVVDWNTDHSKSPAKLIADEAWDMDYRDVFSLAERCKKEHVDGVMAGYSETRVLLAAQLSKLLGTPFYANEEIVRITRDKRSFKELCNKYKVPVPREFCANGKLSPQDLERIEYPAIVKPADYGGHVGITVCYQPSELEAAVEKALASSENKTVVIEEYITGIEMSSIYHISNGDVALALVNDKYQLIENGKSTILCNATINPSKHIAEYVEKVDPYIKDFLHGIHAQNGIAFFQMVVGEKGIRVFEMGYRLNGGNDQHTLEKFNGINHMKMLISYSLTGSMGDDISKNNPYLKQYVMAYLAYVRGGCVKKISCQAKPGEDGDFAVTQRIFPGNVIKNNYTTQQEGLVIKIMGDTLEELEAKLKKVEDGIVIEGENGEDLYWGKFDTKRMFE